MQSEPNGLREPSIIANGGWAKLHPKLCAIRADAGADPVRLREAGTSASGAIRLGGFGKRAPAANLCEDSPVGDSFSQSLWPAHPRSQRTSCATPLVRFGLTGEIERDRLVALLKT